MSVGDRMAFGEYVRSRSHALLRAAQSMTGNRADAEDHQKTIVPVRGSRSRTLQFRVIKKLLQRDIVHASENRVVAQHTLQHLIDHAGGLQ